MTGQDHGLQNFHPRTRPWLAAGRPVVLGVSGGADSVALLHMVTAAGVVATEHILVGHFNHQLRPDAGEDAHFVQQTCQGLAVACRVGYWQRPSEQRGNVTALARAARYDFLTRLAMEWQAGAVAVAHHEDDQGETFLERLVRGSGVRGLAAMSPWRPLAAGVTLIRPLLAWRRREIEHWLQSRGLPWREDPSNALLHRQRNRLRHQVIPSLGQALGVEITPILAATAQRLGQADQALEWMVDRVWQELAVMEEGQGLSLCHHGLAALPDELILRVVDRCRRQLNSACQPLGQRGFTGLLDLCRCPRHYWLAEVRGVTVARRGARLYFASGRCRGEFPGH